MSSTPIATGMIIYHSLGKTDRQQIDHISFFFFSFFFHQKIGFDTSRKLSLKEEKNIAKCHLLKFYPECKGLMLCVDIADLDAQTYPNLYCITKTYLYNFDPC